MKKITLLLFALLILGACNAPTQAGPTPDLVATQVSIALTNLPSATLVPIVVEPTATIAAPTAEVTLAPSETPTNTSTPEPSPTPTLSDEDPAIRYGNPTRIEEFDAATGAWVFEDDWFSMKLKDGKLEIVSKGTPYWNSWYTTGASIQDFYLETTLSMVKCSGKDRVGLAFRLKDDKYYIMGLTCDETWGFERYTPSGVQIILEYEGSDLIRPTNENNRLGVLADGNNFTFYINGIKVGEVYDDSYPNAGTPGFVTRSAGTINFKTAVENLKYWVLP